MSHPHWSPLSISDKSRLVNSRVHLHAAAQLPAMFARSFHPASEEDEFGSLLWYPNLRAWCSQPVHVGGRIHQIALDPALSALIHLQDGGELFAPWSLHGKSMEEAVIWLRNQAKEAGLDDSAFRSEIPYDIGEVPTTCLKEDSDAFAEWAHYYDNAFQLLLPISEKYEGAGGVRTWPHHFDIAVLITHPQDEGLYTGIGLSPGDHNYDRPYFYTSPYPAPDSEFPELTHGFWHTDGFTSMVLPMETFLGPDQQRMMQEFVTETVGLSCKIVGAD